MKIQVKTTMRYHPHLLEWLLSKWQEGTSVGQTSEKSEPLCTVGGNVNWCSHYGKLYGDSSKNKKYSYYVIHFWVFIQKKLNHYLQNVICVCMCIIIHNTKTKNISRVHGCINIQKMWNTYICIYINRYYSAIKKGNLAFCDNMDEPSGHYAKGNMSARKKQILCYFIHMWYLKTQTELIDTENRLVFTWGRRWSEMAESGEKMQT